jgi:hypothetical protein
MSSRAAIYGLMHRRSAAHGSPLLAILPHLVCTAGLLAMIADTGISAGSRADLVLSGIVTAVWGIFFAVYALRIWSAPEAPEQHAASAAGARLVYLRSASGWIDLMAALALPVGWLTGLPQRDAQLFAIVWALKYIRRSSGLALLLRLLQRAFPALVSVVTGTAVRRAAFDYGRHHQAERPAGARHRRLPRAGRTATRAHQRD